MTEPATRNAVYTSRITGPELTAAAIRRARGATVPAADLQAALTEVHRDWQREYRVVEIAVNLVDRAMALAEQDGRRGYEAMHLAAALAVNQALMTQGQRALVFVSADRDR